MPMRRRLMQQTTFQDRVSAWAESVCAQAAVMSLGRERDDLLKKLRRAETATHLQDWADSSGLRSPE